MYYHTDKSEYTTWYFKDRKLYELIWEMGLASEKKHEVKDFINAMPNNGFVAMNRYENILDADLKQLIYQCTDDSVSYDSVREAYANEVMEVQTDLSYISRKNLDKLLIKLTGYSLDDNDWNLGGVSYLESIDVYCIMHGDTNYEP